jgi:hypothetical protein
MKNDRTRGNENCPTDSTVRAPEGERDTSSSATSTTAKGRPGAQAPDDKQDAQQTDSSTDLRCDGGARPGEPEPERFADVHRTVSGRIQFINADGQPGRWITTDTVTEVSR